VNTGTFVVARHVDSRAALRAEIVAGRAAVGIEVPAEYARRRSGGRPADVLVLVDGSDSSLAAQSLAAVNGLALVRSLEDLALERGLIEPRLRLFPRVLFNPDSRSANLLLPGLTAILLTFSGTILAAFSIVKERERGTLEQLMVTPVSPVAVVLGKLLPYLGVGLVQLAGILLLMTLVFRVPIHGSAALLVALAVVYLLSLLAAGLVISSRSATQMEAVQAAQSILLPSIFLSGYVFPIASLPGPLQVASSFLPATHFIAIARGVVIRGAGFADLSAHVGALVGLSALLVLASTRAFRKTVG
jgi:ABC-2 type transport system permease protein